MFRTRMRWTMVAVAVWTLLALATGGLPIRSDDDVVPAESVLGLPAPSDPERPGAIVLHGGGRVTDDVFDRFVELAGGKEARIVFVPCAGYRLGNYGSEAEYLATIRRRFSSWVRLETSGRIRSFRFLYTDDPDDAHDADFVEPLESATGVWFSGGDQQRLNYRFVDFPEPTRFQRELRGVVERGGVVGGTSAGTAAIPEIMTLYQGREHSGAPATALAAHGLGLLTGAIVEQHFDVRSGRLERFTGLLRDAAKLDRLTRRPGSGLEMSGLAVEEPAAVVIQGNRLEALGNGGVHVFLKSGSGQTLTWHTLASGESAELRRDEHGAATLRRDEDENKDGESDLENGCAGGGAAVDQAAAVRLAREYLAGEDDEDRDGVAAKLAAYEGEIEPVLQRLSARTFRPVDAGYHPEEHFSDPKLRDKHPDDLLYFTVPKSYRPERATGLIVFLHGGGNTSSRRAPRYSMNFPEDDDAESSQLGDLFDATGMVAVGPFAPWDEESSYRWCLEEAEEYLADVIRECKVRFNIDADRVFLVGHSMGGFGAYHHIQRQPDRFAGVVVNAGSWQLGQWPVICGTRLCIVQGVHDAEKGVRWHYTDVEYARWTDKLLAREKLDYVYMEHDGGHSIHNGKEQIAEFFSANRQLRRDPCYPRVALATPVGYSRYYSSPVVHNRWLTLDEAVAGKLEYDELVDSDDGDFDSWRLTHRRSRCSGASIEAENRGDNTIAATTRNVARFTVWLHPRMVDVNKPVTVVVNGQQRFRGKVKPSLLTALESYERRGDWGLIYPIKIELAVGR